MTIDEKKYLKDIIDCIESIDEHLESRRILAEYIQNKTKRRAVERELEIIGEAMNNLLKINPTIQISFSRIIVNLRNKIIHAYDSIDNELIWKIIMKDLPILKSESEVLISQK